MSNDYFEYDANRLTRSTLARAESVNAVFDSVVGGFEKLPALTALRGGAQTFATDTGTANSVVLTIPGITDYTAGLQVRFKKALAGTGAQVINLNGIGVKTWLNAAGGAYASGDLPAGAICEATYDGSVFRSTLSDAASTVVSSSASAAAALASANAASASASTASAAAIAAAAAQAEVDAVWYGPLASAPVGAAIGAMYLNITDTPNAVYVLTETGWAPVVTVSIGGSRTDDYTGVTGTGPFTVSGGYTTGDVYKNGVLLQEGVGWTADVPSGEFSLAVAAISSDVIAFRGYLANDAIDIYTKAEADAAFLNKTNPATARGVLSVSSTAEMNAAIRAVAPAGERCVFYRSAAPTGFLKANGAAVSVSTYADLTAAIYCGDGNNAAAAWGYRCTDNLNPSTSRSTSGAYIVLPDERGEFMRGFDDGRGVDSGRSLWATQADQNKAHTHTASTGNSGNHSHSIDETTQFNAQSGGTSVLKKLTTSSGGATVDTTADGNHTHTVTVNSDGGAEARPRNVAALVCIRY